VFLNPLLACRRARLSVRPGIVDAVARRSVLVTAGWLGAVVVAVLVGLGAINVIGAGLTSSGDRPRTAAEVRRKLAELPDSSPPATTTPTAPAYPTTPPHLSRSFTTRGGTVVAGCESAGATIRSMSPASGFAVHEKTSGAAAQAEGEFRGTSGNHNRVRFTITCAGGTPVLSKHGGGGDD
jgi:hypothetical protein